MSGRAPAGDLPVVDMARREFWTDPHSVLRPALAQHPVATSPGGQKLVLGHPETTFVLRDPGMRTIGTALLTNVGIEDGPLFDWWKRVMFNTDPPHHTRIRKLVSRAFTPRSVDRLRPRIEEITLELLERHRTNGTADLVEHVAHPLPSRVTCELLGVPRAWQDEYVKHSATLGLVFSSVMPDDLRERCETAVVELRRGVETLLDERRGAPRDDLLSALLAAEADGDRLSTDECVALVINLLFAGHDTTRGMLSIGMALLLRHPEQAARVRDEPGLAIGAVEEVLRYEPPVLGSLRTPSVDVEVGGVVCRAGEPVNTLFVAASRDPRVHPDPDRFDVTRDDERPLAFGAGIHHCLGAALARAEGQIVFPLLLRELPDLQLEGKPPAWVPFAAIRRLDAVRVRWQT